MRKLNLLLCLVIFLVVSLIFIACEPNSQEKTIKEFTGKGAYWSIEFLVTEEEEPSEVDISAKYLGDSSDIEEVDTIKYNYKWLHEEAEFIEEKDSVEFHGEDPDSTVHMISIASALTKDRKNMYSGESFISDSNIADIEMNELADYIRIYIEWNEQEEMLELEKLK
ncbi:hypothetical protein [Natranaerofaba carboxydovora]|uniref:hypothetical protein n=1 Tax=Natranaerofaba carboxydovora TaxID=2742683 RepID=UPI001F13A0DF|nr:hypothetical protein [Natranaerofaba carboxydovora]UMZ72985.1 hypothetical protein ACONDI_00527 [Natranaerofaba carboxydovora]